MFLLDTNVVSDLRRPRYAAPALLAWARETASERQFISCITVFELELGIRRRERRDPLQGRMLRRWMDEHVLPQFDGRILGIDAEVALRCASLHVPDPAPERDSWIAATALVRDLTVVTRNTADFLACGARVLNPWAAPA